MSDHIVDANKMVVAEPVDPWRQQTAHLWRKHRQAEKHMMRWMYRSDVTRRGNKISRRLRKWMREYERTIMRMPMPPDDENL